MVERGPEQINFDADLRRYLTATPFVPFDIVTSSGDRYAVEERLQMAMGGSAIVLVLPKTGIQLIRKNQITAVHVRETV
jgi:hypothetical protein